ncbi:MAG: hypothetical protein WAV13_04835 [Thermodesulfovibrionales bacterium]
MEGISLPADREKPDELQTSRVRIIEGPPCDTADVIANTGVVRDMIRAKRINTLIFLIEEMLTQ